MKVAEVRELATEELRSRLDEAAEELFNLRFQHATGQLENYRRLGMLRRDLARMRTILRERELGIEPEPQEMPARRRSRAAEGEEAAEGGRSRRRARAAGEGEEE